MRFHHHKIYSAWILYFTIHFSSKLNEPLVISWSMNTVSARKMLIPDCELPRSKAFIQKIPNNIQNVSPIWLPYVDYLPKILKWNYIFSLNDFCLECYRLHSTQGWRYRNIFKFRWRITNDFWFWNNLWFLKISISQAGQNHKATWSCLKRLLGLNFYFIRRNILFQVISGHDRSSQATTACFFKQLVAAKTYKNGLILV